MCRNLTPIRWRGIARNVEACALLASTLTFRYRPISVAMTSQIPPSGTAGDAAGIEQQSLDDVVPRCRPGDDVPQQILELREHDNRLFELRLGSVDDSSIVSHCQVLVSVANGKQDG